MSEALVVFTSGTQIDHETGLPIITTSPDFQVISNTYQVQRHLTARLRHEEVGGYSAQCVELPGAISEGDTLDETIDNVAEAIALVLEDEENPNFVLSYYIENDHK